jgi:hypothetical protein
MHTAFQVFTFGLLSYFKTKDLKFLLLLPLTVTIHFSMFFAVGSMFLLYVLRKIDLKYFFVYFIVAHFLNTIDLELVRQIFEFLPQETNTRLSQYANEPTLERHIESGKFFLSSANLWAQLGSTIPRYIILILTIFLFFGSNNYIKNNIDLKPLLKAALFLYGSSLIIANLPSGYRFMTLSSMLFFAYFTIVVNNFYDQLGSNIKYTLKLGFPILLLLIFRLFRNLLDFTSFMLFIGNFFTSLIIKIDIPIIDTLKRLI